VVAPVLRIRVNQEGERSKGLWRRLSEGNGPIIVVLVSCVCAAVIFTVVFRLFADEQQPVWDWFVQLAATLIGTILAVAGGLWLFNYQSRKTDENREEQLLTNLAGETQANQNILNQRASEYRTREGTTEHVILVRLSFLVAQEALRSGVFTSNEARFLSELIGELQTHNEEVRNILSTRTGLESTGVIQGSASRYDISDLQLRQKGIRKSSAKLLQELEKEGIEVPVAPNLANSAT
jgi:uncharacterized membrane protein YccC